MIFALIGILKQPPPPRGFEAALYQHFAHHIPHPLSCGYLRGPDGCPVGLLGIFDAATFDDAQACLDRCAFDIGGNYDHVDLATFNIEVGRLD